MSSFEEIRKKYPKPPLQQESMEYIAGRRRRAAEASVRIHENRERDFWNITVECSNSEGHEKRGRPIKVDTVSAPVHLGAAHLVSNPGAHAFQPSPPYEFRCKACGRHVEVGWRNFVKIALHLRSQQRSDLDLTELPDLLDRLGHIERSDADDPKSYVTKAPESGHKPNTVGNERNIHSGLGTLSEDW